MSPKKAGTYRANYGASELHVKDIRDVGEHELPKADLLWASFPCQDHSSAGARSGFKDGTRGRLVFHVLDLLTKVAARGNAPSVIVLENVMGLLTAAQGEDFESLLTGLVSVGYRIGAVAIDAEHWLPHSRPRVFIVAVAGEHPVAAGLTRGRPRGPWYPKSLVRALRAQPSAVARNLLWWTLPEPAPRTLQLRDIVEPFGSPSEKWRTTENVDALLALCRPDSLERLAVARGADGPVYGIAGLKRWDRTKLEGRALLLRTDGVVPCLMGKPDLHYNQLVRIHGGWSGIRPLTIIEFGRLMGVPEDYRMPPSVARAARLAGEGVAVPAVRWLAAHLLEPLTGAAHVQAEEPPVPRQRRRPERARKLIAAVAEPSAGMKQATVGTTVYLLPEQSSRVRDLADELQVSVHEVIMFGLDRLFMERGMPPVRRVPRTRRAGRARCGGEGDITRLPSRRGRGHALLRFVLGRNARPHAAGLRSRGTRESATGVRCRGTFPAGRR